MKAIVTGVAGFVGSHLAERLIQEDFDVIGIDSFEDYYPHWVKEKNMEGLRQSPRFSFIEANLLSSDISKSLSHLDQIGYIFHQAAQAGVRSSWGENFQVYTNNNILATQKLLEIARGLAIKKFIYASSSSVYGDADSLPIKESTPPHPLSPYGASKLAAESLCL